MHAGAACQDGPLRVVGVDVARTRAISKFRDCVVDLHGPLELDVRHRAILVGMATGAIRAVGGELPGDDLGVRRVTAGAVERCPVIHEGGRGVPVDHRGPGRGPVTCLARQRCGEVCGRFAFSHRAVVAAGTRRRETGVIDPRARKSHGALVTSLARSIRDDMVRRLPDRRRSVVTACAIRNDSGVVHAGSGERCRAFVAVLAGRIGDDVIGRLAERRDAVVARRAAAGDASVARLCIGCGRIW